MGAYVAQGAFPQDPVSVIATMSMLISGGNPPRIPSLLVPANLAAAGVEPRPATPWKVTAWGVSLSLTWLNPLVNSGTPSQQFRAQLPVLYGGLGLGIAPSYPGFLAGNPYGNGISGISPTNVIDQQALVDTGLVDIPQTNRNSPNVSGGYGDLTPNVNVYSLLSQAFTFDATTQLWPYLFCPSFIVGWNTTGAITVAGWQVWNASWTLYYEL